MEPSRIPSGFFFGQKILKARRSPVERERQCLDMDWRLTDKLADALVSRQTLKAQPCLQSVYVVKISRLVSDKPIGANHPLQKAFHPLWLFLKNDPCCANHPFRAPVWIKVARRD